MLFKEIHLKGIRSGQISLAFRKWEKPSVQSGSLLHTSIGLVLITEITKINEKDITETDIINAGFADKKQLLSSLRQSETGVIFRIVVRYHSEDPRIKLREKSALTEDHFLVLKQKTQRLDLHSKQGPWTGKILQTINDNPRLRAIEISAQTGLPKEWLKLNIRKLKNLGLTISHEIGYEISPLGKLFLGRLEH